MKEHVLSQIGQLFITGFSGAKPSAATLNFLAEERIGGVILFAENCPTHQDTRENIVAIKSRYASFQPLIAVDQEGGRICRVKGAPIEYRSPASYGKHGKTEQFAEDYGRSAVAMASLGINLNFAPVCDIFLNQHNECLVGRCFGESPQAVIPFVRKSVLVSRRSGLLSCLKHFPGLGVASVDPHIALPAVDYDLIVWQQREKQPFMAGLDAGADMIMTTHLSIPNIDSTMVTGSAKIISTMIRNALAFDGPVITDDLTMAGAGSLGHIGERTIKAFNAGHDLLLFGKDTEVTMEAFDYFREAVNRGEIDPNRIKASLLRVSGMKFKLDSTLA